MRGTAHRMPNDCPRLVADAGGFARTTMGHQLQYPAQLRRRATKKGAMSALFLSLGIRLTLPAPAHDRTGGQSHTDQQQAAWFRYVAVGIARRRLEKDIIEVNRIGIFVSPEIEKRRTQYPWIDRTQVVIETIHAANNAQEAVARAVAIYQNTSQINVENIGVA